MSSKFTYQTIPDTGLACPPPIPMLPPDEDTKTKDPSQVPVGPVTTARAKRFKEELNSLVHKVLKQEETVVNIEGEQRLVLLIKVD